MPGTINLTIDSVKLALDVTPLEAWESSTPMGPTACGLAVAAAIGLTAWGATHRSSRVAALWVPLQAAAFAGLGYVISHDLGKACVSGPMGFWPGLRERFEGAGLFSYVALLAALGLAIGVALDIAAWRERRIRFQLMRFGVAALVAVVGGLGVQHASAARKHGKMVASLCSIPRIAVPSPVLMHTGQQREPPDVNITLLARRAKPGLLIRPKFSIQDPGSERDLAKLADGRRHRVWAEDNAWTDWERQPLRMVAPQQPGPFKREVTWTHRASGGALRVTNWLQGEAIAATSGPLLPIHQDSTMVWARTSRVRAHGAKPKRHGEVKLTVDATRVEDGFIHYTVRVDDKEYDVVPWAGSLRMGPHAKAQRFIEPANGAKTDKGQLCRFEALSKATCHCGDRGPIRCMKNQSDTVSNLVALGLGLITLGVTAAHGVRGRADWQTELRLIEVDGAAVQTPSFFDKKRPGRR